MKFGKHSIESFELMFVKRGTKYTLFDMIGYIFTNWNIHDLLFHTALLWMPGERRTAHNACTVSWKHHFADQRARKRSAPNSTPTLDELIFHILLKCTNEWVFWTRTIKPWELLRKQCTWFQNEGRSSSSERWCVQLLPKGLWTELRKQRVGTMLELNLGGWQISLPW